MPKKEIIYFALELMKIRSMTLREAVKQVREATK